VPKLGTFSGERSAKTGTLSRPLNPGQSGRNFVPKCGLMH